jgi:carbon monoxide dehydrogenase subunit G
MKISNEFTVHTPIDRAWRMLTDLEGIAPCMPGAQLTGVDGDVYQGKVKVKVGPVVSEFAGTARFAERDDSAYRGVIDAKGRDARSAGNASALVTAVLRPEGESTTVTVDTDLKISGKLAQFGSGMIKEVSAKLLAQFVTNLEAKLAAEDAGLTSADDADAGSVPAAGAAPAGERSEADAEPPLASTAAVETAPATAVPPSPVSPAPASPAPVSAAAPRPAADEPEALDLLDLAGSSIYKRLVPIAVGAVVVGAVIAWFVSRR